MRGNAPSPRKRGEGVERSRQNPCPPCPQAKSGRLPQPGLRGFGRAQRFPAGGWPLDGEPADDGGALVEARQQGHLRRRGVRRSSLRSPARAPARDGLPPSAAPGSGRRPGSGNRVPCLCRYRIPTAGYSVPRAWRPCAPPRRGRKSRWRWTRRLPTICRTRLSSPTNSMASSATSMAIVRPRLAQASTMVSAVWRRRSGTGRRLSFSSMAPASMVVRSRMASMMARRSWDDVWM